MIKKTLLVFGLALTVAFAVMVSDDAQAEKPSGSRYSNTFRWTQVADSTDINLPDTFTTWSGSSGKLFRFDEVRNYGSLTMALRFEYEHLDTGTAAADIIDTSLDTIAFDVYTADQSMTPAKLIYTAKLTDFIFDTIGTGTWTWVDLSDSVLADNVYLRLRSWAADSSTGVARTGGGVDYVATLKMWAR